MREDAPCFDKWVCLKMRRFTRTWFTMKTHRIFFEGTACFVREQGVIFLALHLLVDLHGFLLEIATSHRNHRYIYIYTVYNSYHNIYIYIRND